MSSSQTVLKITKYISCTNVLISEYIYFVNAYMNLYLMSYTHITYKINIIDD